LSWHLPLVRPEEYSIIEHLLSGAKSKEDLKAYCALNEDFTPDSFEHAMHVLQGDFRLQAALPQLIKEDAGLYSVNFDISSSTFVGWILDLIEYGLRKFSIDFCGNKSPLKLYGKYSGEKALMALNWHTLFRMTGVVPVGSRLILFIDLNKDSQIEERLKYQDKFLSNKVLQWESQTGTTIGNSKDVLLNSVEFADIFVRKAKKEDGVIMPFVYLGLGKLTNKRVSSNVGQALLFDIVLEKAVPEVYKYDFGIEDTDQEKN
jgi:hypothetical protein